MYGIDCWSLLQRFNYTHFLGCDHWIHDGFVQIRDEGCWKKHWNWDLYNISGTLNVDFAMFEELGLFLYRYHLSQCFLCLYGASGFWQREL